MPLWLRLLSCSPARAAASVPSAARMTSFITSCAQPPLTAQTAINRSNRPTAQPPQGGGCVPHGAAAPQRRGAAGRHWVCDANIHPHMDGEWAWLLVVVLQGQLPLFLLHGCSSGRHLVCDAYTHPDRVGAGCTDWQHAPMLGQAVICTRCHAHVWSHTSNMLTRYRSCNTYTYKHTHLQTHTQTQLSYSVGTGAATRIANSLGAGHAANARRIFRCVTTCAFVPCYQRLQHLQHLLMAGCQLKAVRASHSVPA